MRRNAAHAGGAARYISVMSEHLGEEPLPAAPPSRLIERKIALDGVTQEFPLERWLVTDELIVGRWLSDGAPPFEQQLETRSIIAGTPDQVVAQLRPILEETRPGILSLWGNDGGVSHADSKRCIELLGREVMPALRDIGDELGLTDPFQANAPVSLDHARAQAAAAGPP